MRIMEGLGGLIRLWIDLIGFPSHFGVLYLVVFIRGSMVGLLGFLSCLGG